MLLILNIKLGSFLFFWFFAVSTSISVSEAGFSSRFLNPTHPVLRWLSNFVLPVYSLPSNAYWLLPIALFLQTGLGLFFVTYSYQMTFQLCFSTFFASATEITPDCRLDSSRINLHNSYFRLFVAILSDENVTMVTTVTSATNYFMYLKTGMLLRSKRSKNN